MIGYRRTAATDQGRTDAPTTRGAPTHYEIRVAGVLDGRWSAWFDGLEVTGDR